MQLSPHFKLEEFLRSEVAARMGRPITIDEPAIQTNLDMGPVLLIDDVADSRRTNAKFFGDLALNGPRSDTFANISNCAFCKLCRPIKRAARSIQTTMRSGIRGICLLRIPSDIYETIVGWHVIVVATILPFRTWTNKCSKNNAMQARVSFSPVLAQQQLHIPAFVDVRLQNSTMRTGAASALYSSLIAYLIKSFISNNWEPSFNHSGDYI